MESLRQFAYGASHELNNPLANIVMRAQSLLRHETCVDRRKKLQTIETQALRAHEMISDVMLFAHPPQPRFDSVDLRELVGSVLIEMEPMFATRRIEVRQSAEGQFTDWQVDVTQLAECLRALFKNAIESIGQDGWMNVSLARDESEARLSICDSGAGIDPHIIQHIFDPFFSGREAGRGLGFGLSKAWRIVQLHGGRITCINPIAGHTTFEIALPQHQNGSVSM
ncbi:MAG TPA: HAMP domain-containing sensor histidine kinase [Pirellulaceae bacterium]|nr:HAMP domain-containing sensor histidine kinase [Pirellulaceae bacterium]